MSHAEQSLEGVTVIDLGQIYNGPYATFLMVLTKSECGGMGGAI